MLGAFGATVKELGISNEHAQTLLDKLAPVIRSEHDAKLVSDRDTVIKQWQDETRADPEIGGANLKASLTYAARAIDKFGGPELRQLFDESGLGNHKALVAAFVKIGKSISEDVIHTGKLNAGGSVDPLEARYPTTHG